MDFSYIPISLHSRLASVESKNVIPRYFSNSRPKTKTNLRIGNNRVPLQEIFKPKLMKNQRSQYVWNYNQKGNLKYTFEIGKIREFDKEETENLGFDNESLVIESLFAVPKVKKLNPIREKLVRMCHSNIRPVAKKDKGCCLTIVIKNIENFKDDQESPSPLIKPRYVHK